MVRLSSILESILTWILVSAGLGVLVAVIAPKVFVAEKASEFFLGLVWGLGTTAVSLLVSTLIVTAKKQKDAVATKLDSHKREVDATLSRHEKLIAQSFYNGFFTMLAGHPLRAGFRDLESVFADPAISGELRDIMSGFLTKSAEQMGKSGLVMVDAPVTEYVVRLRRLLQIQGLCATATCVVRPYWFISDAATGVVLSPADVGSHLPAFADPAGGSRLRLLSLSETMLAEMLLTAYVDKSLLGIPRARCPSCRALNQPCGVHTRSDPAGLTELPEVLWFQNEANSEGALRYLLAPPELRTKPELEDRVFVSNAGGLKLDVRFQFTNLTNGTMWLRWGAQARDFGETLGNQLRGR